MQFKCGECGAIIRDDDDIRKIRCSRCGGKILYKRNAHTITKTLYSN